MEILIIIGVTFVVLFFIVKRHSENYVYKCPKCESIFSISIMTDFLSPHYPDKKRLKCPKCGNVGWFDELKK